MSSTLGVHVVCANCHAVNRVPAERLQDAPVCGRCKNGVFAGQPVELNNANFQQHVHRSDLPILIDFWAPWCGPCRTMAPAFAQVAAQVEPTLRLGKINTETEPALAAPYGIRSIPTLILLKHGKELARQSGAVSAGEILRWLAQHNLR